MLYVDPTDHSFALRGAETKGSPARQKAVLEEFEQLFLNQLLKEMRKSVPEGGVFSKSREQAYFEEIFDGHLAGEMARSGQFGIAKEMGEQLAREKEARTRAVSREPTGGLPLHPKKPGFPVNTVTPGMELPKQPKGLPLPAGRHGLPLR